MSNYKDIQKKNDKELVSHVQEKREEVRAFRFGTAGAGTRNVSFQFELQRRKSLVLLQN